jgi:protein TonB
MVWMLRISLGFALLQGGWIVSAQEPATIDNEPAVRFEQAKGYFHYAAFCRTPKEFSAQAPKSGLPLDQIEFGIGWYVKATVMRAAGGASPEIDGRIVISPHHVRFMPANPESADQYFDLPRADAELKRSPGQSGAVLHGNDVVVKFQFRKICLTCASGTPVPPGESAPLVEQEFALFDDTLKNFESGWRKTYRLSKGGSTDLASENQPAAASRPAAHAKASSGLTPSASPAMSFAPSTAGLPSKPVTPAADSRIAGTAANSKFTSALKTSGPAVLGTPKGRPVKIASGTADGLIIKKIPPQYPLEAKLVRLEGTVVVRAVIDQSGEVSEVNALSGPPLLESAAVDAVKQWQYKPFAVNGQPVDVETTIEVVFALDRSQSSGRGKTRASDQR